MIIRDLMNRHKDNKINDNKIMRDRVAKSLDLYKVQKKIIDV